MNGVNVGEHPVFMPQLILDLIFEHGGLLGLQCSPDVRSYNAFCLPTVTFSENSKINFIVEGLKAYPGQLHQKIKKINIIIILKNKFLQN